MLFGLFTGIEKGLESGAKDHFEIWQHCETPTLVFRKIINNCIADNEIIRDIIWIYKSLTQDHTIETKFVIVNRCRE